MFSDRHFAHLSPDRVSFYDEALKKQLEGSYRDDGKAIHVYSAKYGAKSVSRGRCYDHSEIVLLVQKVLSEMAGGAEKAAAEPHSFKKAA